MEKSASEISGSTILEMENLRIIQKSALSVEDIIRIDKANEDTRKKRQLQDQYARYFGYYRQLRVESQNLITSFRELKTKFSSSDADSCNVNTIPAHLSVYRHNKDEIKTLIKEIGELVKNNPTIHTQSGEKITGIENVRQWIEEIFPELEKPGTNIVPVLDQCIAHLCNIVYQCGIVTIPPRVKDHLKTVRTGYQFHFYKSFEDELCNKKQSDRILKYLADHTDYISGIVDVQNGVIYKAEEVGNRKWSYLRIFGMLLVGGILTTIVFFFLKSTGQFPGLSVFSDLLQIPILYSVAIFGAVMHIVIDAFKAMKSDVSSLNAVKDWLLWIHIKEAQILRGLRISVSDLSPLPSCFPLI
jgi:hypothetical protein